jgi:hypothetical protein
VVITRDGQQQQRRQHRRAGEVEHPVGWSFPSNASKFNIIETFAV